MSDQLIEELIRNETEEQWRNDIMELFANELSEFQNDGEANIIQNVDLQAPEVNSIQSGEENTEHEVLHVQAEGEIIHIRLGCEENDIEVRQDGANAIQAEEEDAVENANSENENEDEEEENVNNENEEEENDNSENGEEDTNEEDEGEETEESSGDATDYLSGYDSGEDVPSSGDATSGSEADEGAYDNGKRKGDVDPYKRKEVVNIVEVTTDLNADDIEYEEKETR